jgi:hypothetical protein
MLLEQIYFSKSKVLDVDDIMACLSLFLLSGGSPEASVQAMEQAVVYGMLHGGQVAPSLNQL